MTALEKLKADIATLDKQIQDAKKVDAPSLTARYEAERNAKIQMLKVIEKVKGLS